MIKEIDNIILLGTSHVAKQSAKEIEEAIEKYNPEVVGIELDFGRFEDIGGLGGSGWGQNWSMYRWPGLLLIINYSLILISMA